MSDLFGNPEDRFSHNEAQIWLYIPRCRIGSTHKRTVKFLNFQRPENFAVIYLKFNQGGQTLGYIVKMIQME